MALSLPLDFPPRRLFLIDGLGALLTASLLAFLLAPLERYFGMPVWVLYPLAAVAGVFALYSLLCYARFPANWQPYLRGIAVANLSYCVLTAVLVVYFWGQLTVLGVLYFVGEMGVVIGLVAVEVGVYRRNYK
jgi:hypothetical protein